VSLRLLRERRTESKTVTWAQLFSGDVGSSRAGVAVTHETALSVSAFYRCVEIRSNLFVRMGAPRVQRRGAAGWADDPAHPINGALAMVPGMPPEVFYQTRAGHRTTVGRGAAYIDRTPDGRVVRLIPIDPARVQPFRENGLDGFLYTAQDGQQRRIPASDVWNWVGLGWDGVSGYSALRQGRDTIGAALAAREHASAVFRNGALPGLVFEHPGVLSEATANRLKQSLDARFAGVDNHFKSVLLEEGLKVAGGPSMMTAEDAQLIESRGFDSREIAVRFGVPPAWVGDTATRTFATAEQEAQVFLENTADPDIRSCEASLEYVLFTEDEKRGGDVRIRFDRTPLGMADVKSQAEADKAALAGVPWQTVDEVRERRGLGPLPDGRGAELIIPINLVQAAKPGSGADPASKPPADPPQDPTPDPDPSAARKVRGFDDAVVATRSRMVHRLATAARAAGKDPSKFTAWADCAREAHEPIVREAFAFADAAIDTRAEVDALFAALRSACDRAQESKPAEFPAALDAALGAMEREAARSATASRSDGGAPGTPTVNVTVNGGPVDARTTVNAPPVTVTPPSVEVSVDARGGRSLTFKRDANGRLVAAEATGA